MDTNMSDQRKVWPLGGYAPGGYTCKCTDCGEGFEGDKRAVQCLNCAIIWANKQIRSPSRLSANDEEVTDQECDHICMGECATEGCENCGLHHYESAGVGSYYCGACLRKIKALSTKPEAATDEAIGWLFFNPDSGEEYSDNHPVESGECVDAERIRPATAENLRDQLLESWKAWAEDRQTIDELRNRITQPSTPASGEQMKVVARRIAMAWAVTPFVGKCTCDITRALIAARQEGRKEAFEEAAKRLEPADGGYFNPPEGFYEALAGATDADEIGFREFRGDTGNWAHFMHLILVPYAAAIRSLEGKR